MNNGYETNGLIFWSEEEIRLREHFVEHLRAALNACLLAQNPAFRLIRIEAPILTPRNLINSGYSDKDIWAFPDDGLALRPETTMGSYAAAKAILDPYRSPKQRLPVAIWQHGQSFRREQDQVTKNMRLKAFWQAEWQILFAESTANDYYPNIVLAMNDAISELIGDCHTVPSDRLPDYSTETTDIMRSSFIAEDPSTMRADVNEAMEVCSISRRKDFPGAKNIEVAVGTDRLIYSFLLRNRTKHIWSF